MFSVYCRSSNHQIVSRKILWEGYWCITKWEVYFQTKQHLQVRSISWWKKHSSSGRIKKSILEYELKHPVLLPREGHTRSIIMRYYHEKVAHASRGITINELRSQGYRIINCTSAVKSIISKCVECRWFRGKVCQQKTGELPSDRLTQELPFTYCSINMFGPLKMVLNKENFSLHLCPAERCILKLKIAWVLIALYWHWED